MNIEEPNTSRILAILIQPVIAEDRMKFIADAKAAPDMETFVEGLNNYRTAG